MSFSMPITRYPDSIRWRTDSEPMSPPDPVTIAALKVVLLSPERRSDRGLIGSYPFEDVGEDLPGVAPRAPVRVSVQPFAIRDVDAQVAGPCLAGGPDRDLVAGELAAQSGGLEQRQARLAAAADVERR